jgi:hypothetical protein
MKKAGNRNSRRRRFGIGVAGLEIENTLITQIDYVFHKNDYFNQKIPKNDPKYGAMPTQIVDGNILLDPVNH